MSEALVDHRPSVPFRAVLLSAFGLWTAYFLLATLRWEMMDYGYSLEMLPPRLIVALFGVVVTLGLWLILRVFDAKALWVKSVAALTISLPAAILMAMINTFVFAELQARFDFEALQAEETSARVFNERPIEGRRFENEQEIIEESAGLPPRTAEELLFDRQADIAFSRYFMLLAWCALYLALLTGEKARAAERREQEFKNAAKAAELRSLRYQVNPHFLFNTFNSLSALVLTGKTDRAEQMIQTISRFYRHSLVDDPTSDVLLEQEFDLQKLYLEIEAVRFPERLRCEFDLPEPLREARVPGMILQPLVENSVKYAVSAVNRPVTIRICAKEEFDRLVISVSDDGPGTPEQAKQGFGIGLANVRDRLEARFGQDVVLSSASVEGGYKSEIRIPLTRNG